MHADLKNPSAARIEDRQSRAELSPRESEVLDMLAKGGRVDWNRILVLRTASDFDQPPPGMTAAENLAHNTGRRYVGYLPAVESAWRVGNTVVQEITTHWEKYK